MNCEKFMIFLLDENGQGMVEHGLIIALIALAAVLALTVFGASIKEQLYDTTVNNIPTP